eukprot:9222653-Pyramimonas_sp.AAC.1
MGRNVEEGTLTPATRHFISDKCRLLTGVEAFLQQGIHFGHGHNAMEVLASFPDALLCDLAGNAFHEWVAAFFFLASHR